MLGQYVEILEGDYRRVRLRVAELEAGDEAQSGGMVEKYHAERPSFLRTSPITTPRIGLDGTEPAGRSAATKGTAPTPTKRKGSAGRPPRRQRRDSKKLQNSGKLAGSEGGESSLAVAMKASFTEGSPGIAGFSLAAEGVGASTPTAAGDASAEAAAQPPGEKDTGDADSRWQSFALGKEEAMAKSEEEDNASSKEDGGDIRRKSVVSDGVTMEAFVALRVKNEQLEDELEEVQGEVLAEQRARERLEAEAEFMINNLKEDLRKAQLEVESEFAFESTLSKVHYARLHIMGSQS